ncbi:MAG: hypothetical protein Q4G05_06945, partial [Clostridia bacterium]|nr:hypothetical protein [Clostridia bacterium]
KELLKNGRGAEIFSGSNFVAQNHTTCGQSVDTSSHHSPPTSHCSRGITLIALIITIVIMLILAGITINLTLGENGIFQKAKLAKQQYELATIKEKMELELSALELEYNTSGGTDISIGARENAIEESTKGTLVYSSDLTKILGVETKSGVILIDAESESELQGGIRIGDTVNYIPDENLDGVDTDYGVSEYQLYTTDEAGNRITKQYGAYTGDDTQKQIITQEELTWKILDISEGKVTLTSEYPTTQRLSMGKLVGICNGVYIFNNICNELYSKENYGVARSIKYEDLQKATFLTDKDCYIGKLTSTRPGGWTEYGPAIWEYCKGIAIDGVNGTEYEKSEQTELISYENSRINYETIEMNIYKFINRGVEKRDVNSSNPQIENLLTKDIGENQYWIATRLHTRDVIGSKNNDEIYASSSAMRYWGGIYETGRGISPYCNWDSLGWGNDYDNFKLKPIVELNENVEFSYNNETLKWDLSI